MKLFYRIAALTTLILFTSSCLMFSSNDGATSKTTTTPETIKCFRYRVARGETLFSIAKKYSVTTEKLKSINKLKSDTVKVGTFILIPGKRPSVIVRNSLDRIMNVHKPFRPWRFIVLHHSATDFGNMARFDKEHRKRGWRGVGYDFVIDNGTLGKADGNVEITPRWTEQMIGSHCRSPKNQMNKFGIGICLVGDFTNKLPSKKQLASLIKLVKFLQQKFHIPRRRVFGHRDAPDAATECPGNKFPMKWVLRQLYR